MKWFRGWSRECYHLIKYYFNHVFSSDMMGIQGKIQVANFVLSSKSHNKTVWNLLSKLAVFMNVAMWTWSTLIMQACWLRNLIDHFFQRELVRSLFCSAFFFVSRLCLWNRLSWLMTCFLQLIPYETISSATQSQQERKIC